MKKMSDIVETLKESTNKEGSYTITTLLESLGSRSFGPMLLIPSLLALVPIVGGIPGMSIFTGTWIALVAGQLLFGFEHPWLPKRLKEFEFSGDKLRRGCELALPYTKKVDRWLKPRWDIMTQPPILQVVALMCVGLALSMYPLAIVPFGVTPPALALVLLSLGIAASDGISVFVGLLLTVGSGVFAYYLLYTLI
ncbi:MAG: exopolysaccharide biosynthesis protein [Deltaproteobacteria bacterium]|nr:MAG: exopolysaccharide biosynthesis protein [Deltaproteobacteria bacterium]